MLITCPECAHSVSDKAISCPNCGYPIQLLPVPVNHPNKASGKPRSPKKHKKLPNGYGCIRKLSGKRCCPFAAYPPTTQYRENGTPVPVPAIGYYEDWYQAFDALREYNHNPYDIKSEGITFSEVYELYYKAKYENSKKTFSESAKNAAKAAYKNCAALHNKKFKELRKVDLQKIVDSCPLKHASLELIVSLLHGMYKYAIENDMMDKDYSAFVTINIPDDDENGAPFTPEQIDILWKNKDMSGVDTILIMIYTGFRINEYKKGMEYHLDEKFLLGGLKTKAGKQRTVPIHTAIYDMVAKYGGNCFYEQSEKYRKNVFYPVLESLGISVASNGTKHTPHDCRHTFSWLCDRYKVDDLAKHLLMGHSLGGDVEKSVYGHRTLEELRAEIEKIHVKKAAEY